MWHPVPSYYVFKQMVASIQPSSSHGGASDKSDDSSNRSSYKDMCNMFVCFFFYQ